VRFDMTGHINNILFVCTGNICRSPFAEGLLKNVLAEEGLEGIGVDSAGLLALPGNSVTPLAQRVAAEFGVDLSGHRAKAVSESLLSWSDLVLVMEKPHEEALLSAIPGAEGKVLLLRHFGRHGSRRRGIADPYGLQYEAYRFCFLDIEDAVSGLAGFLSVPTVVFEPIRVRCYEGYRANESPRSFKWKGQTYEITKIFDRWYDGGVDERSGVTDYFKVQTGDESTHIIRYNRLFDSWAIRVRSQNG
jgi:protein-tyrosine-phosphatase